MVDVLGWLSSLILLATIATQVHRQWRAGTSQGVSAWLFVGQCAASLGFFLYSLLIGNWVFVVTNGLLAVAASVGLAIVRLHRRREGRGPSGSATAMAAGPSRMAGRDLDRAAAPRAFRVPRG